MSLDNPIKTIFVVMLTCDGGVHLLFAGNTLRTQHITKDNIIFKKLLTQVIIPKQCKHKKKH
jgi:hypothetical protein